jgi:amidase
MGYVGWIGGNLGISDPDKTHKVESQIVTELLSLGAVLYCKTSLPQTLLFGETKNNLIGETLNPNNRNLSCGGSSGGEAALMALGGSSVGVGTDIGGSLRIPTGFCGIFSIKPTSNRLSYRDAANTNPGQDTYRSTLGFMGTSINALEVVFKSVLSTEPWLRDPAVFPIPFRNEMMNLYLSRADSNGNVRSGEKPLKMGVLWSDGMVGPHPPVLRGLRVVAEALKKAGHKVSDDDPTGKSCSSPKKGGRLGTAITRKSHNHNRQFISPLKIFCTKPNTFLVVGRLLWCRWSTRCP